MDSVRTISALLQVGGTAIVPPIHASDPVVDDNLEVRVASISAELAVALAQAQSRVYDVEDRDEGEESGSGQEMGSHEPIVPNTSGIRGLGDGENRTAVKDFVFEQRDIDDDDDSDAFPVPLRPRKGKDSDGVAGAKRRL